MNQGAPERAQAAAQTRSRADEGEAHIDRWIEQLERGEAGDPYPSAMVSPVGEESAVPDEGSSEQKTPARRRRLLRARGAGRWLTQRDEATRADPSEDEPLEQAAAESPPPVEAARVTPAARHLPDAEPPPVLTHVGRQLQHLGTVALRGPYAPSRETVAALGLGDAGTLALDFVGAWFGAPFDSVNVRLRRGRPLSWGFWPLAGDTLAEGLALWKTRSAEGFQACLATHGIDVELAPGPSGAAEVAELVCVDAKRGLRVRGETAEALAASDPARVTALALAGRDAGAQLAQIEAVVRRSLAPAMARPVGEETLGQILGSARGLAVLFYVDLCFGARGVDHLAEAVEGARTHGAARARRALGSFTERLRRRGFMAEAHHVLRILSSPELR